MEPEEELGDLERIDLTVLKYRVGASPIEDERMLRGSSDPEEDDSPKGLDIFMYDKNVGKTSDGLASGSQVLLTYIATRANIMNMRYLWTIIKSGANVNHADNQGQTAMHEAALFWPLDMLKFLFKYGADVNRADMFGRTPLHVAVSVNRLDVIIWLIAQNASINATTIDENQTPMHFASKYNSSAAIDELFKSGARLDDRDYKERTPLFLAAENGRVEASRSLIDLGAPVGVYDDIGMSCLTHMINKMPLLAQIAMNQFVRIDKGQKTVAYYFSYLATDKWKLMRERDGKSIREMNIQQPLEAIVANDNTDLIMHPVMQGYLKKKYDQFGFRAFIIDFCINLLFTLVWTILTVTLPTPVERQGDWHFYTPVKEKLWKIIFEAIGVLLALFFLFKSLRDNANMSKDYDEKKINRIHEIRRDTVYCHPRWPQELNILDEEIKAMSNTVSSSIYNVWFFMDMLTYMAIVVIYIVRLLIIYDHQHGIRNTTMEAAHFKIFAFFVIVLWLRLMKNFRPFIFFGPFIAILGYVIKDTLKFTFLYLEFYIPYCAMIWVIFGKNVNGSLSSFHYVLFNVWRLTMADDFGYDDMNEYNPIAAQLVSGTYMAIVTITCINLYIALLSETFTRVFENATARAYLLQAQELVNVEVRMGDVQKEKFGHAIATNCSPEVMSHDDSTEEDSDQAIFVSLNELLRQVTIAKDSQTEMKEAAKSLMEKLTSHVGEQEDMIENVYNGLKVLSK